MPTHTLAPWFTPNFEADRFLPEGPRLSADGESLLWVNIQDSPTATVGSILVYNLKTKITTKHAMPGRPGFALPTTNANVLLVGMDHQLTSYNTATRTVTTLATLPHAQSRTIINDAEPTPDGTGIIFGTKDTAFKEPNAALYFWQVGGTVTVLRTGQTCSNGKVFSPDGRTLYDIDTPTKTVTRYAWNAVARTLTESGTAIDFSTREDYPDGMIDGGNNTVVVAFYHPGMPSYGQAVRFDLETGIEAEAWALPGSPRVTCPCWVAIEGGTWLLCTTADEGMSAEQRQRYPQAGALFAGLVPGQQCIRSALVQWP